MAIASSKRSSESERVAALAEVPLAVCENEKNLQAVLSILRNRQEPVVVRLAALQSMATAAFSVVAFESSRNEYIATLRAIAVDEDAESSAGARPSRTGEGRLRAEETARRVEESRKGADPAGKSATTPGGTTFTQKLMPWRERSSASLRTPSRRSKPSDYSRLTPRRHLCSRRSSETRANLRSVGRSRRRRCTRSSRTRCRHLRARSFSTRRNKTRSGRPA